MMNESSSPPATSSDNTTTPATIQSQASPSSPQHQYDAWVMAGGRLFRAHGSVLAAHSPYLRAATASLAFSDQDGQTRLLLPHVPAQGFAAILAYMYTGRLPITPATLYEVSLKFYLTYILINNLINPKNQPKTIYCNKFIVINIF